MKNGSVITYLTEGTKRLVDNIHMQRKYNMVVRQLEHMNTYEKLDYFYNVIDDVVQVLSDIIYAHHEGFEEPEYKYRDELVYYIVYSFIGRYNRDPWFKGDFDDDDKQSIRNKVIFYLIFLLANYSDAFPINKHVIDTWVISNVVTMYVIKDKEKDSILEILYECILPTTDMMIDKYDADSKRSFTINIHQLYSGDPTNSEHHSFPIAIKLGCISCQVTAEMHKMILYAYSRMDSYKLEQNGNTIRYTKFPDTLYTLTRLFNDLERIASTYE